MFRPAPPAPFLDLAFKQLGHNLRRSAGEATSLAAQNSCTAHLFPTRAVVEQRCPTTRVR